MPSLLLYLALSASAATLPAALGQASAILQRQGQAPTEAVEGGEVLPEGVSAQVDLSSHFSDGWRPQGDIGSCHAFTAVALLESAMYKRTGRHARFSEADLFMRRILMRRTAYHDFVKEGAPEITEEFWADKDLKFALKHGVGTSLPYGEFAERYQAYRAAEERTLADLERQRATMTPEELALYEPREHWAKLQRTRQARAILERRLTGGVDMTAERAASVEAFQGLKVVTEEFEYEEDDWGWAQGDYLKRKLDEGHVVGVGGMGHVYAITGYTEYENGKFVFHARDSEGEPTLEVWDLWTIGRAYTLE